MKRATIVQNHYGEQWFVEYRESETLSKTHGFLATYGASSCITLRITLPPAAKRRSHQQLLKRLATIPLGTPAIYLWEDIEEEHC